MKLELLEKGKQYKYKDLCEAFEVEPKTGNAKKAQFKTFEQYLVLEKNGTWFTVVDFHEQVQERDDKRKDNGKSEASQKALAESDKGRKSFFEPNELQLAILWTLGSKYYEEQRLEENNVIFIPKNKMHVAIGLCNEFFNTLFRNVYYYSKLDKDDNRETVYDMWKVKTALNLYDKWTDLSFEMQSHTITALNQLQRKKVLEYSYWKAWSDGKEEKVFTDEQMKIFLATREHCLGWWNEEHQNRQCETVGDIYKTLLPKEVKEFEEHLKVLLASTKEFRDLRYYFSCYKTIFTINTIKRELKKRGFDTGTTANDFNNAFIENMAEVVVRINSQFIKRQVERIDKARDAKFEEFEEYERKLEEFYTQVEKDRAERRGFGKRTVQEPKHPNVDLIEYENYNEVLEILYLGLKLMENLTIDDRATMQGIEHCIEVNSKDRKKDGFDLMLEELNK